MRKTKFTSVCELVGFALRPNLVSFALPTPALRHFSKERLWRVREDDENRRSVRSG
jgi:hypothetical protein